MKKISFILTFVLLFISGFYLLSKIGQNLPQIETPILKNAPISDRTDIKIKTISTGTFETLEGFLYAGGSFFSIRKGAHNATLIQHPKGNLLIDTGLGRNVDDQFEEMTTILKPLFGYKKSQSAFDQLSAKSINVSNIVLTHMHWDHASGLKDFGQPQVYTTKEEFDFSRSEEGKPPAYMKSQYEGLTNFNFINFSSGHYEIFDQSYDYFNDGSVIFVKLGGHSPGSIGIFVNLSKDKRYFFTGDLTWSKSGLDHGAHKFIISSLLVDKDRELVGNTISKLISFLKTKPEIKVLPAHDFEAFEALDRL